MYLMYVDESGDTGLLSSPTRYFVLTGLVVHELRWYDYKGMLVDFRRRMKGKFGLRLREEIHASAMLNKPGELKRIRRNDRLTILRSLAHELAALTDLNSINIAVDKRGKAPDYDVFGMAWKALIQRLENTMSNRNFRGPANADERGIILPDHTDDKKLTAILRRMRQFNPIPNQQNFSPGYRNLALSKIVEDPFFKDSCHSYFIQACDLVAYLLFQQLSPSAYMKSRGGHNYFKVLDPILCKVARPSDPQGVVRL